MLRDATTPLQGLVSESADFTFVTTPDWVCRYASPACQSLFGWSPAQLEGRPVAEFVHADDLSVLHAAGRDLAAGETVTASYRFLCADESYRWGEARSRPVDAGGSPMVVTAFRDIADRQHRDKVIQHAALTDPLTGVATRTVLMDRMHQGIRRLGRGDGLLGVLYMDLDHFKIINDSLGHRGGDAVLLRMAERLRHHLRPSDTLARMGGDEFVILAEDMADEHAILEWATRIVEAGREPFRVGDEDFVCTVSVGIASTSDPSARTEELLHDADLALYRAKGSGRDRVEVFDEDLRTDVASRRGTERMLRSAISDDRVFVEYQPIIALGTGGVVGAEALVRVRDHENRKLLPASFLEVAQHAGLLIRLDTLVLADAVQRAAAWNQKFPNSAFSQVSVNVTARHLADIGFHAAVMDQLAMHAVPSNWLTLELTEQVLMEASNSAMTGLRVLRDAGVGVSLDDFGTGYSSLTYLRQFPIDQIKLDPLLVEHVGRDPACDAMVGAVVSLSHALELTVVAEGVETTQQVRALQAVGCDSAQGFWFAAQTKPEEIDELILIAEDRIARATRPTWRKQEARGARRGPSPPDETGCRFEADSTAISSSASIVARGGYVHDKKGSIRPPDN